MGLWEMESKYNSIIFEIILGIVGKLRVVTEYR